MLNIVVVDDELRIVEGLAKIIEHIDPIFHVCGKFSSSTEAFTWLAENSGQVDVVITDISMPQLSGLELVEKLRQLDSRPACLILTGYGEFDYAKRAISLGVVDYLLKPVDSEELETILRKLDAQRLDARRATSAEPSPLQHTELSREVTYVKQEIEAHFATFDLDQVAEKLQMSKDYLSHLFTKEVGCTIRDYLFDTRMEQACALLSIPGGYKVYEVCSRVGYEDQAYFSKKFKEKYQVAPKDYQKHWKHKKT